MKWSLFMSLATSLILLRAFRQSCFSISMSSVRSHPRYVGGRRALFLDEISTGLDSATLFNIVSMLKRITRCEGCLGEVGTIQICGVPLLSP